MAIAGMRAILVVAGLVRVAAAEPELTCYVGTDVEDVGANETQIAVVALRVVDRPNRRVTQTLWTDRDAERAITHVFDVDPEHGTFTYEDATLHVRGTGTLEGKAWAWSGYHAKVVAPKLGLEMTSDAELGKGQLVVRDVGFRGGKQVSSSRLDAIVVDCKQLDARRAALARVSARAVHACYEGTTTTVGGPGAGKRPVVIEQVVDATTRTIERRQWRETSDGGRPIVFAIKGDKIVVSTGGLLGHGTIAADKAGAWTGYTWSTSLRDLAVTEHGTIGGSTLALEQATTHAGKPVSRAETTATAFDCAKLPERRAATAATRPIP